MEYNLSPTFYEYRFVSVLAAFHPTVSANYESSHFNTFSPGDLEKRARIREPATLVILNATRADSADYRCEVTAPNDQKSFDEILITLTVRGEGSSQIILHPLTAKSTKCSPCLVL